jgi:peptidoglycan hydrolase-like protein with peptidoglycan-binding domain
MAFSLTWLPEVLRQTGLKVAEVDGWASRGRRDMARVRGVMCHHTGTSAAGNMPTLGLLKNGRSDLPGPLSQLGLGRDGTYYIVAAGIANHAGAGEWEGLNTGNSNFIGIEAENGGKVTDPWPDVQLDAYRRGVAALLKHIGAGANMCCGHREYARPRGRKPDPVFDMVVFRSQVDAIMRGTGSVRSIIPAFDSTTGKLTLRRGARGDDVKLIQREAGLTANGVFDPATEAAVRQLQREAGIVPDGIVGPKTWAVIV